MENVCQSMTQTISPAPLHKMMKILSFPEPIPQTPLDFVHSSVFPIDFHVPTTYNRKFVHESTKGRRGSAECR